jgi:hypothetical protein
MKPQLLDRNADITLEGFAYGMLKASATNRPFHGRTVKFIKALFATRGTYDGQSIHLGD